MTTDYRSRLSIKTEGDPFTEFRCPKGELLAVGYERVVIGGRGPYIEFSDHQIKELAFESPVGVHHVYYIEGRSRLSEVKLYFQLKPVDYADYRIGMFYISPFDVYVDGKPVIVPL